MYFWYFGLTIFTQLSLNMIKNVIKLGNINTYIMSYCPLIDPLRELHQ